MFSADATYSCNMKIDSFKYGINILLTRNPGESLDRTICLPINVLDKKQDLNRNSELIIKYLDNLI